MRIVKAVVFLLLSIGLIYIFNSRSFLPAPLGKLLAPQTGLWQNAEDKNDIPTGNLKFDKLGGKVDVYFDDRLVPHIFAEQENDAYFVQGYVHAMHRLWQMELQTLAAAGRTSEVAGDITLSRDREFRRLGMVYAAENSLKAMESDPTTKVICDSYTAGVNAYIHSLTEATLPVEYKLTGRTPEPWSNLKSALFLKMMSYDLASHESDFEMTAAKNYFSKEDFKLLFPQYQDSLDPIISRGTVFPAPSIHPKAPANVDSAYFNASTSPEAWEEDKADKANGSNNWAVAGSKSASGAPILCNDPHLGLNLPSIWYEMQISTPQFNAYGATFPGAPNIIIGFNDSCAFGFTNGGRDVRDYYEIKFKDNSRKEYLFNGEWKPTEFRYERIKIAGKPDFIDTVAYTVFGPVMYDASYAGRLKKNTKNYAVKWTAHEGSNDLAMFVKLNHAKNYADYTDAAQHLSTPGQNCIFACKSGDIALRTQGAFPAKWKGQGDFIMPGTDSSYLWQGIIPQSEVPLQHNPERGFVSSANQRPVDTNYTYYLGREYPTIRGLRVNKRLTEMSSITPDDMMKLQNDNYNLLAAYLLPVFIKNIDKQSLNASATKYYDWLTQWDFETTTTSKGATVFDVWWKEMMVKTYADEYAKAPAMAMQPMESTLMEAVLRDSAYKFFDNINTPQHEMLKDVVNAAFNSAATKLSKMGDGELDYGKFKQTKIFHIMKLDPLSTKVIDVPGTGVALNANKMNMAKRQAHGPSWRMIVSLTNETEAYGVYPGGQNGNPGSRFYTNFVNDWIVGKYYKLWMMKKEESADKRVIGKITFSK